MNGYEHHQQHQHSGERPKLFGLESHGHGGMSGLGHHHNGMNDFQHMVQNNGHHNMQQHHQGHDFDHEPLMMNMHNPSSHFYPPMGSQMLQVSADYQHNMDNSTPSSRTSGTKRSREDLNLKEKKRMFKLNDRITELKTILDEAGVQSKKNKQSVLDNTYHYIGMLRSNLLIAKQKAERAEKQAEMYRNQVQQGGNPMVSSSDSVFERCFQQSSTPRLMVDMNMELFAVNSAFLSHTGQTEEMLKNNSNLRSFLCVDEAKFDKMLKNVKNSRRPMSMIMQAQSASSVSSLTLTTSVMTDEANNISHLEFNLIPFEISSDLPAETFPNMAAKNETQELSPSSSGELIL